MSSDKPIIAICGATGSQGGSVLRSLHSTGKWKIRALTRDPNNDKAKKLSSEFKDIEVVKGDSNSDEELRNAFKGAHTVFAVTNFWDPEIQADHKKEETQGKRLVDIASESNVKYFIWSSLASCIKEGNLSVPHFDGKNLIEEYAKTKKNMKSIFFYASFYFQNFQYFFPPQKADDGSLVFALPISDKGKIAMYDVADTGKIVAAVLSDPDKYVNQDVSSAGDDLTVPQVLDIFTKVTGKKAVFKSLGEAEYKKNFEKMPAMGDELYNMFVWFERNGYYGKRDPFVGKKIASGVKSFEQWLKESKWTG
jgi:uncharacterized protein YbjT (DUF2867 family)